MTQLLPKVTEITLDSGVRVHVAPLSVYQRIALTQAAEKLYPYPDKAQYEEALPEGMAIEGLTIPAEQNPEYQTAVKLINNQRGEYTNTAIFNLCLTYPDFPRGKPELIEYFAAYLDEQRDYMALPDDEWEATLRFAVIRSPSDEAQIISIVREDMPLTEAEITDAMRIFRPSIPFARFRQLDAARKLAPGAAGEIPNRP